MILSEITEKLVIHCRNLGFGDDTRNELYQYVIRGESIEVRCEGIVHELSHMLLLFGVNRLETEWDQSDMDDGFDKLTPEEQDENEIETTALTIMFGRAIGCEEIEDIARGNMVRNVSGMTPRNQLDNILESYLVSSNRSNFNDLFSFVHNL